MAEEGYRVTLNVYDLSQGLARQLSSSFLGKVIEGIWHTGIVVYGNEYYFGGGIQHSPAGSTPYGVPVRTIELGVTHVPQDMFELYLEEISPRFTAETYSLLTHNCNNFSNEVAQFLLGASIPEYILNLPNEVLGSPMGALIMPMIQQLEATLRAGAVPQAPQFKPSPAQPTQPTSTVHASAQRSLDESKEESTKVDDRLGKKTETVPPAVAPAENAAVPGDLLGSARNKVQEEITREFMILMASGTLRASEAAALATRKVMQRYGQTNLAMS